MLQNLLTLLVIIILPITCSSQCNPSQYYNSKTNSCSNCHQACETCFGPEPNQCLTSKDSFLNGRMAYQCEPSCAYCYGPGQNQCWICYNGKRPPNGKCTPDCDSSCLTCSQTDLDYCLSCDSNKTLVNGKCISYTCDESCLTCDGPDDDECLTCDSDRIWNNGKCAPYTCDSSCSTCSGPGANECLSCPSGRILNGSGECKMYTCDSSCLTCSGPDDDQCLTCSSDRMWDDGQCVPYSCDGSCSTCSGPNANQCLSCPSGKILNGNNQCVPYTCDESCLNCSGPRANQCLSCSSARILDGSECISYTCNSSCLTCSGPDKNQCLTCYSDRVLRGTHCETYTCDLSCLTCSGPDSNQCLTCPSDRILNDNKCEVYSCDESCLTCSGSNPDQCKSCSADKILNGTECDSYTCDSSCSSCSGPNSNQCLSCPSGTFLSESHHCFSCDPSCETCFGPSSTQCSSCSSDKTLFTNGTCAISDVPDVCYNTCFTCTGPLESECVSCKRNSTFFNGYCSEECPTGYDAIKVNESLVCQKEVNLDVQANYISDFDNQVILTFNKNIANVSSEILSNLNISMIFQADQTPIGYNYSITSTDQQILIGLNFDGPLIPNNILAISLANQIQTNLSKYLLSNDKLSISLPEYYPYSQSQIQMIKNAAQVSSTGGKANSIYSMGSSFIFKSLHSMRSELIDSMINYFIFMNINLPPNFIAFAKQNIGEPGGFVPNVFKMILPKESSQQNGGSSGGSVLDQYAAANMTFLRRYGGKLTYFMLLLAFIICLEYMFRLFSKKLASTHPVIKILAYLSCSLRWNFLISEVIADFQESTFSAIYGVSIADNQVDRFASVMGILFTLGSIVVVYFLAKKIFSSSHLKVFASDAAPENGKAELNRYDALHKSIKANKFPNLLFFSILLIRSFGFSLILVLASNTPMVQLAYLLISSLGMITYLLVYVPIKHKSQSILTVGYEIMLLISIGLAITIYTYSKININAIELRSNLGFALMFISMGMIIMNIVSFLVEFYELWKLLKKRKQIRRVSKISPTEIGSLNNNSTLILSNILPSRSSLIFAKAPLTKSPSQQNLARKNLVRTMFKIHVEPSDEVVPEKNNSLEEVEKELKRKGEFKLAIRRNYQDMNNEITKTILEEENSMKDQEEVSIHVPEDNEIERDFNISERTKQNTIGGDVYSRNIIHSSLNEIPSMGSMILDSIRPEKKARATRLLRIQNRYDSKVFSRVLKTLPNIDEI